MCAKFVFLVVCAVFLIAMVESSHIKEKDIDDIIFRLAEMRDDLHLDGKKSIGNFIFFYLCFCFLCFIFLKLVIWMVWAVVIC